MGYTMRSAWIAAWYTVGQDSTLQVRVEFAVQRAVGQYRASRVGTTGQYPIAPCAIGQYPDSA
eukprot:1490455-Rhodomonas_salina.1